LFVLTRSENDFDCDRNHLPCEAIIIPRCTKLPALACANNGAALADSICPTHIAHVERAMSSSS